MPVLNLRPQLLLDIVGFLVLSDERFGFEVPLECPGVPSEVLQPIQTWENPDSYDKTADNLAKVFIENFTRYQDGVSDAVNSATPRVVGN